MISSLLEKLPSSRLLSSQLLRRRCLSIHPTRAMTAAAPASSPPPTDVTFKGERYIPIQEGLAQILTPASKDGHKANGQVQQVFYNPVQQYNRDLSVLAIRAFAEDYGYSRRGRRTGKGKTRSKNTEIRGNDQDQGIDVVSEQAQQKSQENGQNIAESNPSNIVDQTGETRQDPGTETVASDEHMHGNGTHGLKRKRETSPEKTPSSAEPTAKRRESRDDGEEIRQHISSFDGAADARPQQNGVSTDHKAQTPRPPSFRILDALSATGLRALRYAKEIPEATYITANDLSASATAAIKRNAEYNGVADKIQVSTANAIDHMQDAARHINRRDDQHYQVIDLDPYGTAAPFIDSAVRALADGGLLCVTCTDAGVFASTAYIEKAFSQYGGSSIDGPHSHEGGIRLIIQSVATAAARYGLAVEPVLSLSIDFYIRIFIRVNKSPAQVKFLASKSMLVHGCDHGCGAWSLEFLGDVREKTNKSGQPIFHHKAAQGPTSPPNCEHCGSRTHIAGPMWGGPLHNPHFITQILASIPSLDRQVYKTLDRLEGMLSIALSECELHDPNCARPSATANNNSVSPPVTTSQTPQRPVPCLPPHLRHHHPFFVHLPSASKVLHTSTPSEAAFRGALLNLGQRVFRSHTKAGSIATDASWTTIWRVMREWVKQKSPIKEGSLRPGMPGWNIMHPHAQRGGGSENAGVGTATVKGKIEEVLKLEGEDAVKEGLRALLGVLDGGEAVKKGEGPVVFDETVGKKGLNREKGTVLYAHHPPNWGPMKKASAT